MFCFTSFSFGEGLGMGLAHFLKPFLYKKYSEEFLRANLASIFCTYIILLPLTVLIAGFHFYCWYNIL